MELAEALGITPTPTEKQHKVTTTLAQLKRQQRYEQVIDALLNTDLTPTKIAAKMGLSRKTIYKYWNQWQETEEAMTVKRKWHKLCRYLEVENPEESYRGLTKIVYRMTTEKQEIKQDITERQIKIVRMWQPNANPTETPRSNP
jgi:hypothetical protein